MQVSSSEELVKRKKELMLTHRCVLHLYMGCIPSKRCGDMVLAYYYVGSLNVEYLRVCKPPIKSYGPRNKWLRRTKCRCLTEPGWLPHT
jgi:hypothetical protein